MELKTPEGKVVDFIVEGSKFLIKVDPNQDGQALVKIELDLAEVPDELLSLFKK